MCDLSRDCSKPPPGAPAFPCGRLAEEAPQQRLQGLYPQRQSGLWMQRVRVPGGTLAGDQWQVLAAAARDFTPGTPLHLTTRQTLEFHDLLAERIGPLQKALAGAGLTTIGTCGDTVRNVTVCPCSGLAGGKCDLLPLAEEIRHLLQGQNGAFALPRKFKVSLSACEKSCAQPFLNDLGLIARRRGEQWGFEVIAAGSLGARPGIGSRLYEWIAADDALSLVLATFRVFAAHGNRQDRHKARLRHVRERLGKEEFARRMEEEFQAARVERAWPAIAISDRQAVRFARVTLTFANGDITAEQAEALAALAERPELKVRITNNHRVIVWGDDEGQIGEAVNAQPAVREAARPQPAIVACPGTRWCARGLVDTNALADRIRRELGTTLLASKLVCISGCPNGCAHSAVAPIGILGGKTTAEDGGRAEYFNLFWGGGLGRTDQMAEPVARKLSAEQLMQEIRQRL